MARQRFKGEGSIYPRRDKDGTIMRYEATVEAGTNTAGKRRRKTVTGKTEAEVARKLRALVRHKEDNTLTVGKETVKHLLERWLEIDVYPHLRSSTAQGYTQIVYDYLVPAFGKQPAAKLPRSQVQNHINQLVYEELAQNTLRNIRNVLRRAYNAGITWGDYVINPALHIKIPRTAKPQREIDPLTLEQAHTLLAVIRGHRLELLLRVALSLGLRLGELAALRWEDVDFTTSTLRISGSIRRQHEMPEKAGKKLAKNSKLVRNAPKTKQSKRYLTVPKPLLDVLHTHYEQHQAIWDEGAKDFNPQRYVFCSEVGTALEPRNITRAFGGLIERAGLPATTRFHDLRHSCATLLIAQGVHLSVIKDILGHTQISTTANIYGHVYEEVQRDATTNLDTLLTTPLTLELPPRTQAKQGTQTAIGSNGCLDG